ncbi:hypothetical protein MW887_003084 [Aspergillus wentii]|nr:hypothetical protein MW887_003084 [Aspergillus wentii]
MVGFFADLMGPTSIALAENERWKGLRKRFSSGFSHMYLTSAVALDTNMDAQLGEKKQSQIFRLFSELLSTYRVSNGIWALLPSYQKRRLACHLDMHIKDIIKKTFEEQQADPQKQSRSVISLSLAGQNVLTSELLTETCDQLKTFLFAGHDTTSALLQWAFYEMSRNPRVRDLVRLELDAIFGPESSPSAIRDQILKCGEDVLQKMTYTSAMIKETLRLYPLGSTARYAPPDSGLNGRLPNGQEMCLDGVVLYSCHRIIHRNKTVYGDNANEFYPERWLGSSETNIPISPSA